MDALLAIITLAALAYFVAWEDHIKPWLGLDKPQRVKSLPPLPAYKSRSRRSRGSEPANVGSVHQSAKIWPQNVPANVPGSPATGATIPPAASASDTILITPNELQQLAEAVAARASGATIDESIYRGFGLKKGGGPGYRRARELFDLATAPPQPKV